MMVVALLPHPGLQTEPLHTRNARRTSGLSPKSVSKLKSAGQGRGCPELKLIWRAHQLSVLLRAGLYRDHATMINQARQKATPFCSFCGKLSEEVSTMVAGPHVNICDECIGLCITYLPLRSRLNALAAMFLPWKWQYLRSVRSHDG